MQHAMPPDKPRRHSLQELDALIAQCATECGICPPTDLPCTEQHLQDDVDTRRFARSTEEAFPTGRAFYLDSRPTARAGRLLDRGLRWLGEPVNRNFAVGLGAMVLASGVALVSFIQLLG